MSDTETKTAVKVIPVVRSSQSIDETFFNAVIKSYVNLSQNPVCLITLFILTLLLITELDTDGPLEQAIANIEELAKEKKSLPSKGLKAIVWVLTVLVKNKRTVFTFGFMWVPWLAKPSTKNLIVSSAFTVLIYANKHWENWDIILISQFYLVYTQIRNPLHKTIIIFVGLAVYWFGISFDDLLNTGTSSSKDGGKTRFHATFAPAVPTHPTTTTHKPPATPPKKN